MTKIENRRTDELIKKWNMAL